MFLAPRYLGDITQMTAGFKISFSSCMNLNCSNEACRVKARHGENAIDGIDAASDLIMAHQKK